MGRALFPQAISRGSCRSRVGIMSDQTHFVKSASSSALPPYSLCVEMESPLRALEMGKAPAFQTRCVV